jgi:hypothetical protein
MRAIARPAFMRVLTRYGPRSLPCPLQIPAELTNRSGSIAMCRRVLVTSARLARVALAHARENAGLRMPGQRALPVGMAFSPAAAIALLS